MAKVAAEGMRPGRLLSVDLLRGLTIAFMILVNDAGSERDSFAPLQHAYWNGFTPTDLVFPTFLFLVGMTTVFSLSSRIARGDSRRKLLGTVVRRAVLLYVVGLAASSFPFTHLDHIRFVGVLPRIALCYLVVGTLYLWRQGWRDKVVWLVVALVGYWALLRFVPVPEYGVPTRDVPLLDRDGNLAAWVDRAMFAPRHLYERTRDPEGLLSTIPAVGTALLGVLTAMWLRTGRGLRAKVAGIAGAGAVCVVLGGVWNLTLPINKKMWTSSYVLFAGGLSLLLLAVAMLAIDVPAQDEPGGARPGRARVWTPLLVFGTNAIAAYVLADLLAELSFTLHVREGVTVHRALYQGLRAHVGDPAVASLLYALGFTAVCWCGIYLLYRKRVFLKI